MTVSSLCNDMLILAVFMLAGFFIREIFKPVQKLFLPSSLIGGLLLLLLGHQAMGIIAVPESFHELPGVLIDIVMASLVFGVNFNREKISSYLDYSCVTMTSYGMQMCLGVGLGWILSKIWTGLPQGWGVMGVFSFHGGHGTAAATASAFQKLGVDGQHGSGNGAVYLWPYICHGCGNGHGQLWDQKRMGYICKGAKETAFLFLRRDSAPGKTGCFRPYSDNRHQHQPSGASDIMAAGSTVSGKDHFPFPWNLHSLFYKITGCAPRRVWRSHPVEGYLR